MNGLLTVLVVIAVLALLGLALSVRIVQQYEKGVLFRLGRVIGLRALHRSGRSRLVLRRGWGVVVVAETWRERLARMRPAAAAPSPLLNTVLDR
jgi:regulator of protease activity HflC (stomatin/prohibitin superfamily)